MSNLTILVADEDGNYSREGYFDFSFLPRVGEEISIVPHGESIRKLKVVNVEHHIFPDKIGMGSRVTASLDCTEKKEKK